MADDLCPFPIKGIDQAFLLDYKTMIRAHLGYALMALFNLGFYGVGTELPVITCRCMAIGGFANPTVLVSAAFDPDFWNKTRWKVYRAIRCIVTPPGFGWIEIILLKHAVAN